MILHRAAPGVLSTDGLTVVLRTAARVWRVSVSDFRAGKLDAVILDTFDLRALVEATARDEIDRRSVYARRFVAAGRPSVQRTFSFGRGDPRAVWIRGRSVSASAGDARYEAPLAELAEFPSVIAQALGDDVVAQVRAAAAALAPLPCFCGTGVQTSAEHDAIETLASKYDPRAPVDVTAEVGRCTVCGACWTFEASGDSHYSYSYFVHELAPRVGYTVEEVEQILAGMRAGAQVTIGGSRCHTTYRVRDAVFFAEDFDEGATSESPSSEVVVRQLMVDDPDAFAHVLRQPFRSRLADALLAADKPLARARLKELLAFGECLANGALFETGLAWPDEQPPADALAQLKGSVTGLDAYHAVMSPLGYQRSEAAGRFGLGFFAALSEMLGDDSKLRRYRASFHAMAGDVVRAIVDLEAERAGQRDDDPDRVYLDRELEGLRRS